MNTLDAEREQLAALVAELAVVHGTVTLSSGLQAEYYVDLRRATLEHRAAPLIGRLLLFNALDMKFRELKLKKDPSCPVCGGPAQNARFTPIMRRCVPSVRCAELAAVPSWCGRIDAVGSPENVVLT